MKGDRGDGMSVFCAMLERIAAFLREANVVQQSYPAVPLSGTMQQLADATWQLRAPGPLLDPAQMANVEDVLDQGIVRSVNEIESTARSAGGSIASGGNQAQEQAAVATLGTLRGAIKSDRDAIVKPIRRYRREVEKSAAEAPPEAGLASRLLTMSQSRVGPSRAAAPRQSTHASTSATAWRGEPAMDDAGAFHRGAEYMPVERGFADRYRESDISGRITDFVENMGGFDAVGREPVGLGRETRNHPRYSFGLNTRNGQDLFESPLVEFHDDFSAAGSATDRLSGNVFSMSNVASQESAARIRF